MKFHNGCWLLKEGFGGFSPKQVYESRIREKEVTICAPTAPIRKKGDTLGGINLTVRITAPAPDILHIQACHHKGVLKREPEFELELREEQTLDVKETQSAIVIQSGRLRLTNDRDT